MVDSTVVNFLFITWNHQNVFLSVAKIKTERDYLMKSRFLGPITTEVRTEVKEINHQREKLERKRREYDACAHKSR